MTGSTMTAAPRGLRWIALAALAWNLVGTAMFLMQVSMTPEDLAAMPAGQREVYAASPLALEIAFGIAVTSGLLGAIALWRRRRAAVPLFALSWLAVAVQMALAYTLTPAWDVLGPAGAVLPVLLLLVAGALWAYARHARRRGWLG